jgi:hypothetical protein
MALSARERKADERRRRRFDLLQARCEVRRQLVEEWIDRGLLSPEDGEDPEAIGKVIALLLRAA